MCAGKERRGDVVVSQLTDCLPAFFSLLPRFFFRRRKMGLRDEDFHINPIAPRHPKLENVNSCTALGDLSINMNHSPQLEKDAVMEENAQIFKHYNPESIRVYDIWSKKFDSMVYRWRVENMVEPMTAQSPKTGL